MLCVSCKTRLLLVDLLRQSATQDRRQDEVIPVMCNGHLLAGSVLAEEPVHWSRGAPAVRAAMFPCYVRREGHFVNEVWEDGEECRAVAGQLVRCACSTTLCTLPSS